MQLKVIISTYDFVTPSLLECYTEALESGRTIVAVCISDDMLEHMSHPAVFTEEERAHLAEALAGVQHVHVVRNAPDLEALKKRYATSDIAIVDGHLSTLSPVFTNPKMPQGYQPM